MVSFIKDKDLFEHVGEYEVTLVGTNTYCSMTQGLQRKIMLNYPYVQKMNMETKYGDQTKLGTVLECSNDDEPSFTLLYICNGNFRPDLNKEFLSYESLEKCLLLCDRLYRGRKIAAPLLGTSRFDGNGDRDKVIEMLNRCVKNMNLTVYDYFQKSREEELKELFERELKLKETDYGKYIETVKKRKAKADIIRRKNGHAAY